MKKEWLLTLASAVVTVVIALGLVRWLAPELLGYTPDRRLVQTSEEVPSFYENIFRDEDYASDEFLVNDPYLLVRSKPLLPDNLVMGPHDVLGFRNRAVPNHADIVTIGDSQTYGNNVVLEQNWPSTMRKRLFGTGPETVYNMSVGNWGGVNYMRILESAVRLSPQIVIVAFYTGNDPYTDFINSYSIEDFSYLRPDDSLDAEDATADVSFKPEDSYPVTFSDGVKTTFTPAYRYISNNRDNPPVRAGYEIMSKTAIEMTRIAREHNIQPVFTIIPTKEYVYKNKMAAEGFSDNVPYQRLVADESLNIDELADALSTIEGAVYIDVAHPLLDAAMTPAQLYPPDMNGHPIQEGYAVIGNTLAEGLTSLGYIRRRLGLHALFSDNKIYALLLITEDGMWTLNSQDVAERNGWDLTNVPVVSFNQISAIPNLGVLREVDPARYGPDAILPQN